MNASKLCIAILPVLIQLSACGRASDASSVKNGPVVSGTPATVCGKLEVLNVCRTTPSCPQPFLRVAGRKNGYTVTSLSFTLTQQLTSLSGEDVCIDGVVGVNGDPDLLAGNRVRRQ